VFPCTAGQGCIAGREKDKVIQIGAIQAQSPVFFNQRDPRTAAEILTTLAAGRFARRNKYFELKFHGYAS
jgi:hypothetical protein